MKSDSEASVMAVKRTIAEWRSAPTPMLETPVRESMCNGKMERAVRTVQGQLRTLKFALEENIGVNIEATSTKCMAEQLGMYHDKPIPCWH